MMAFQPKIYKKTCRQCKIRFETPRSLQVVCSPQCAHLMGLKTSRKLQKAKIKEGLEKLKTKAVHLNELQVIFNKYIRIRDQWENCISCDNPLTGKFDAGHFYSVGAYPALRFNENNVHAQCVSCNQHKHGNINEYRILLPFRIGMPAFVALENSRNQVLKLSIPEILELKEIYKKKIKQLS